MANELVLRGMMVFVDLFAEDSEWNLSIVYTTSGIEVKTIWYAFFNLVSRLSWFYTFRVSLNSK